MNVARQYNNRVKNPFLGVDATLFDLDGTLIETHIDFPLMRREMNDLASRYGVNGLEGLDILTTVESARARLVAAGDSDAAARFREDAFARLEEIEVEHCANPVEIEGAAKLLDELRLRGIRVGVVTRNCRSVSERLLSSANLRFDVLLTRDDVPLTKPDPSHLLDALERLGVPDSYPKPHTLHPKPCLMIGDHWMDVQAGCAAGMRTVGILRDRPSEFFDPAPPDLLVNHFRELLPLVKEIPVRTPEYLNPTEYRIPDR